VSDALSRAVFVDRDGTLMEDCVYCSDPKNVKIFSGVPEALRRLKSNGFKLIIITNQSGIARGLFTEAQYHQVQAELVRQIGDGLIDASYFCADLPGVPSARRKPEPGMVLEAAGAYDIDLPRSWFIGDKGIDVECGQRAGTRTILVLTGYGKDQRCSPDYVAADVVEAVRYVLDGIEGL
jgi:D-glycero-D-manno-heptose 1,7-bisphosphate phosphatase